MKQIAGINLTQNKNSELFRYWLLLFMQKPKEEQNDGLLTKIATNKEEKNKLPSINSRMKL